ncbi:hypothetical protein C8F01DRAFT_1140202 [Mycena amicta]|nr:hypothetical protein C8F01DRAFT_1140202 [Mycena amicta]
MGFSSSTSSPPPCPFKLSCACHSHYRPDIRLYAARSCEGPTSTTQHLHRISVSILAIVIHQPLDPDSRPHRSSPASSTRVRKVPRPRRYLWRRSRWPTALAANHVGISMVRSCIGSVPSSARRRRRRSRSGCVVCNGKASRIAMVVPACRQPQPHPSRANALGMKMGM